MSFNHEYIAFNLRTIDAAFKKKWCTFEIERGMPLQWPTAVDFLSDFALGCSAQQAKRIVRTESVFQTLRDRDSDPIATFWQLIEGRHALPDFYAIDVASNEEAIVDLVKCAETAFRGQRISLSLFGALYDLHSSWLDWQAVISPDVFVALMNQSQGLPMIDDVPKLNEETDCLGTKGL